MSKRVRQPKLPRGIGKVNGTLMWNRSARLETLEARRVLVAPVAINDAFGAVGDATLQVAAPGVLANDTDADDDALTAILGTGPRNGQLTLNSDGSFLYTPNLGFLGLDTFTYRANDGTLNSDTVTVTITVVDGTPISLDDEYDVEEDNLLIVDARNGVLANDNDISGDTLTAELVTTTTNGTLTLNTDGSFEYQPNENFNGTDLFTYRALDATSASNISTVRINVGPVSDDPVAIDDSYVVFENQPLVVNREDGVLSNDIEVDAAQIQAVVVDLPVTGNLELNPNGSFTYTPQADFNGTETFTYRISQGGGGPSSNLATVTLNITPAIITVDDFYSTTEDVVLNVDTVNGLFSNDDLPLTDNTITPVVTSGPFGGRVEVRADGSFTYTPRANFNGTDTFTYVARVGGIQTLVTDVGLPNGIALDQAGGKMYFTDAASRTVRRSNLDGSNQEILVSGLNVPSGIAVDVANGKVYWTDEGSRRISRANLNGTNVENVITTGLISPRALTIDAGAGRIYWTDAGADRIQSANLDGSGIATVINVGLGAPSGLAVDSAGGKIYWTDSALNQITRANLNGTNVELLRFDAFNPQGLAIDTTAGKIYWAEAGSRMIRRSDLDGMNPETIVEEDLLNPKAIAIDSAGGRLYWSDLDRDHIRRSNLGIVTDAFDSEPATVTINVVAQNDAPFAFDDAYPVTGTQQIVIPASQGVLANDVDPDGLGLNATIVQGATRGTVFLGTDGSFRYTPRTNFFGTDSFTYRATDPSGTSNVATVTLTSRPILRMENVEIASSSSGPVQGSFDVFVDWASVGAIGVTGYEVQLQVFESNSGITFTSASPSSNVHLPLIAGSQPVVPGTGAALQVTDFVQQGSVPLSNNRGLFRANFTVDPGVSGTFHVVFDASFTNISDASARPVVLGGLVAGTIQIGVGPDLVPTVIDVLVGDESVNGWSVSFLDELQDRQLGTGGFSIPVGSQAQLLPVPWEGLTTVKVRFSEDVLVNQDDMRLRGVNVEDYDVAGFTYDPVTFTATWQLADPIEADKLLLILNSDGDDPIRTTSGRRLDGEWEDGFSVYPSGNGAGGGDFQFRFNVLPGDADANRRTNIFDTVLTRDLQFTTTNDIRYSPFNDVNGDGLINISDTVLVSNNQFGVLPNGEPTLPTTTTTTTTGPLPAPARLDLAAMGRVFEDLEPISIRSLHPASSDELALQAIAAAMQNARKNIQVFRAEPKEEESSSTTDTAQEPSRDSETEVLDDLLGLLFDEDLN